MELWGSGGNPIAHFQPKNREMGMGIVFFWVSDQDMDSTLVASCSTIKNISIKLLFGHHKFLAEISNISDCNWAVFKADNSIN